MTAILYALVFLAGAMAKKDEGPWDRIGADEFVRLLDELKLVAYSLWEKDAAMAEACGVTLRTFQRWERGEAPHGYNRRRDVLRDLARFVAEKAGEA